MAPEPYRRKSAIVQAEQASGVWYVNEGDWTTTYPAEVFEALYEKIEMQGDQQVGPDRDIFGFDYSWTKDLEVRAMINDLLGIEAISTDNATDGAGSWLFKPYPLSLFGRFLNSIMVHAGQDEYAPNRPLKFLEVGCGVGTKMVLAAKVFGLFTSGFDYNQSYCNAAAALLSNRGVEGWTIQCLDARSPDAAQLYADADIVYLNRPFVHLELQGALERQVIGVMRRGAYIILGNYAVDPEKLRQLGWREIDRDKVAIVLQKP